MMSELIQEEFRKMMKAKPSSSGTTSGDTPLNASYFVDFAGTTHCDYFNSNQSRIKWIIDSGASSHVTGNCSLLKDVVEPSSKNRVQLPDVCKAVETGGVRIDLLHEKLGHPSDGALSHVVGHNNFCNKTCDACHLAKQSRLSFPTSQTSTETCFELLHLDIWGPYSINSLTGARFMLTIVDDYSRAVWVFLM
ncbi:Retrovirus-related Pol polyprotein from transposon TNT 1-94 [Senna tora]|uniref:Retrovirus-related Pol polyprotein from transposon TNT 1-94 n=1 Tax=Senna tora TaxID=362788 RepID=A0A834WMW3_9FABA|nr:Retrovirus-related Pol polyprotein from transposon TNT 1-94 [Senna tora]